ncbi:MAG TPA: DUF2339 domain-containing protein [Steroidobacteraceae bacterium]|nr:DUF2339 domain-containing protein [Steroidobacteraceae bacterium]
MALAFICGVMALFGLVLLSEGERPTLRPAGLLRWFISGNWTAKLGGLLLSIGSGALLRYLMLHIAYPPAVKIMAGVAIATAFGATGAVMAAQPRRRAISLALSGASLAVGYLTAYSAYAFFHFVADLQALGLLFIVACVATTVAVTRRAVSIAVLSMVGAYLAPAFALHGTDPLPVYGYYGVASLVTLLMVGLRGWRPLIHLSFLFTLGGALFFGWTQKFYSPEYYGQMQLLLLILVAIHLAMPLLERGAAAADAHVGAWARRFDEAYFLMLPLTAAVLTLVLAPRIRHEGALGLLGLAVLWLLAALWQKLRSGAGAARYLTVAVVFLLVAGLMAVTDVPVFLIAAAIACLAVAAKERLGLSRAAEMLAIGTALASSACYVLQSLFASVSGAALLNLPFAEHLLLGILLLVAGSALRRRNHSLAPVFGIYAGTWLFLTVAREVLRLRFAYVAQLSHLAVLLAIGILAIVSLARRRPPHRLAVAVCGVTAFITAIASAPEFSPALLMALMLAGQILYSLLALACDRHGGEDESTGAIARSALPFLVLPGAVALSRHWSTPNDDLILTILVTSALAASLQAQWLVRKVQVWPNWLSPVGFALFSIILFQETLLHIERDAWAVAFELIALTYLVETARFLWVANNRDATIFGYVATAAVATVSAAMLLRVMGPPGTLTILALNQIAMPAVVSLLWAAIGGLLTWLATRRRSRILWSIGAAFMVAAALKLILLDFGSLGEIGNILAMMAAGGVFLLVAWLAPFPPHAEREPPPEATPNPPAGEPAGSRGWLWVLGALAVVAVYVYGFRSMTEAPPAPVAPPATSPGGTPATPVGAAPVEDVCRRFVRALPTDYRVYAAGDPDPSQGGTFAADGGRTETVNVRLSGVSHDIVLALGSTGPTAWRLRPPGSTSVVGVILSGLHRSSVTGLGADVPVLHAALEDHAPCGYFQIGSGTPQGANRFVSRLLVHAVDANFQPSHQLLLIGADASDVRSTQLPAVEISNAAYLSRRNGASFDVTGALRSQCAGNRGSCAIHCGNDLAGDPDFGQGKICRIIYTCGSDPTHTTDVQEGMNLQLHCD